MAPVVASSTCDTPAGPPQVAHVQVTPSHWSATALGDTMRFTAVARTWLLGTIPDLPITWTSEPPDVVFVAEDGWGVAQNAGTAQVRASIGGVTAAATVSVVQVVESVVILSYFGNTIGALGDSIYLYVDVRDRNGYSVPGTIFTLQSLHPGVAIVTLEGWVKAVSPGVADIVALAAGKADTAPVHVVIP